MARKTFLVAAQELRGGTRKDPKDPTSLQPHTAVVGTELTKAELARLGLSDADVEQLTERGAIVEQIAHVGADEAGEDGQVPGTTGSKFEGLSIDQMRKALKDAKVDHPKDASPADLMKIAIDHQVQAPAPAPAQTPAPGTASGATSGAQ